ncbi:MAG: hypothetical protein GY756_16060 [bacterium]|nr:hypothetical protein [bacterium]
MRRNRTDIKLSVDRRKVNRIYWIITIFVILSPFTFLVYKTLNPPVSIEIKSLHDGYVSKIEQKKILIKSPFLEKKLTALKTKLANLNE